jgi:hypothetical protein
LIKPKHIFENLFTDINPPKDSKPKRRCLPQCESLGEMFSNGVYSYPKPETSKPSQNKPQTFLTESHVAETAEATSDHLSTDDDEETHKEPRPVSPHIFQIDPTTLNMTATSEPVTPEPSPKSQP